MTAEAFNHWNENDPAEIPTDCAKCHNHSGYLDYLGEDGTASGSVENAVVVDVDAGVEVIGCDTCHNASAETLTTVVFPSGVAVTNLGAEARCMVCHQGTESNASVDEAIDDLLPADGGTGVDDDTVYAGLPFVNIHYFAAGTTKYGGKVHGAYEYDGNYYDKFWAHVDGEATCITCHDSHSLEVDVAQCATCHAGAADVDDLRDVRMAGSFADYDGDGNTTEGVADEIDGLAEALYGAIQNYATNEAGIDIIYSESTYPYFFIDINGNGVVDAGEAVYPNMYNAWTPRLLKAAYNYQYSRKDTGAFAHNPKYVIQVLYDTMADLGTVVTVDMTDMVRGDHGHFDSASEGFRHWDEEDPPEVAAGCARCHSADGFDIFVTTGTDPTDVQQPSDGLTCENCHTGFDGTDPTAPVKYVDSATFPGGTTVFNSTTNPDSSFVCMSCHQGRHSKATIDAAIASSDLGFKNVHYAPAAAILYGDDAHVGYEYDGKSYSGHFTHMGSAAPSGCAYCHETDADSHSFDPIVTSTCTGCHIEATVGDPMTIRKTNVDFDGDSNTTEALLAELQTLADALYAEIQDESGDTILYSATTYPYWFIDTNGNNVVDVGEISYSNAFDLSAAPLMKAAHNYQLFNKEAGAYAHNPKYMAQLLIDSIENLGGTVSGFNRPTP